MDGPEEMIPENGTMRLSDSAWEEARRRAMVIASIAVQEDVPRIVATEAAQQLGLSVRTIYRFVQCWRQSGGSVTCMAPPPSTDGKGQSRVSESVEHLINHSSMNIYMNIHY